MSALDQLLIQAYQQDLPATDRVPAPHLRVAKQAEKAAVAVADVADDREVVETEVLHDTAAETKQTQVPDIELYVGDAEVMDIKKSVHGKAETDNDRDNIIASATKAENNATVKRAERELVKPIDSPTSISKPIKTPPVEADQATAPDVEKTTSSSPRAKTKEFKPAWEVDRFGWTEICKTISDDLQADLDEFSKSLPKGRSAFLMVGTVAGAGCTTTTLCIAKHLAGQGKKLAIIDADFTDRGLTRSLKVNVDAGIETVLAGISELEDIAIRSLEDQIVLIPGNAEIDLSGGQALNRLADIAIKLNPFFDVVLIDAGVEVCNEICERRKPFPAKAIIVNRSVGEDRKPVDATTTMLRDAKFSIFGIVENFIGKEV